MGTAPSGARRCCSLRSSVRTDPGRGALCPTDAPQRAQGRAAQAVELCASTRASGRLFLATKAGQIPLWEAEQNNRRPRAEGLQGGGGGEAGLGTVTSAGFNINQSCGRRAASCGGLPAAGAAAPGQRGGLGTPTYPLQLTLHTATWPAPWGCPMAGCWCHGSDLGAAPRPQRCPPPTLRSVTSWQGRGQGSAALLGSSHVAPSQEGRPPNKGEHSWLEPEQLSTAGWPQQGQCGLRRAGATLQPCLWSSLCQGSLTAVV